MLAELIAEWLHDDGQGKFDPNGASTIFVQRLPDIAGKSIGIFETTVRPGPVPHHRSITARVVVRGRDRDEVREILQSLDGWKNNLPPEVALVHIFGPDSLGPEKGQERWAITLECVMLEGDI